MIITIHQPEHLPWLGLIDKISKADIFVTLDTVQYEKKYFQNRNKIRTKNGFSWLTAHVKKFSSNTVIKDMELSYEHNWVNHNLNLLKTHYSKAEFFDRYFNKIEKILIKKHIKLAELNCELIDMILESFGIKTKIVKASDLGLDEVNGGTMVNFSICKALSATLYLSGISGKDYLDLSVFENVNIKVSFQEFHHPIYKQQYEPFIPCMSSIDLLFNYGPESKDILFGKDVERLP